MRPSDHRISCDGPDRAGNDRGRLVESRPSSIGVPFLARSGNGCSSWDDVQTDDLLVDEVTK